MILIITGNGKGKTTSAIGTAIRGLGWGKKVSIVFFDKGGSHYGEQAIFDLLKTPISVHRFGQQRFDEKKQTFRFKNEPGDFEEGKKAMTKAHDLLFENHDLIICDEIINCMNSGLVKENEVRRLVDSCPKETHLLLTGRNAPPWLIEKADLVSEIQEVKHYYKKVKKAIKGIDY